jgi:hypothetical protein
MIIHIKYKYNYKKNIPTYKRAAPLLRDNFTSRQKNKTKSLISKPQITNLQK